MNITPQPKTIFEYALLLSEQECRDVLVDPKPFQKQLRAALAEQTRVNGHGRKPAVAVSPNGHKHGHPKATPSVRERKPIARVPCENCGVSIAAYRQGKHKCAAPAAK